MKTKEQLAEMEARRRDWARENGHLHHAALRELDVDRIEDDYALLESIVWFEHVSEICDKAYAKLPDDSVAREVAQFAALDEARINATAQLHDQELLKSIYFSDPAERVRSAAVLQMTDQEFIRSLIDNEDNGGWVRTAAVRALTDPELLRSIASDPNSDFSTAAIYNPHLNDQSLFVFLARSDNNYFDRIAAVSRITNKQRLMKYVTDIRENGNVRCAALTNIDQKTLEYLAFQEDEPNFNTNVNAVEKINDQAVLERLVNGAPSEYVRYAAAHKITDQAAVMRILNAVGEKGRVCFGRDCWGMGDSNGDVRAEVIENVVDKAVMARHALMDCDFRVRRATLFYIEDIDILLSVSQNDPHPAVREEAARWLKHRDPSDE